MLLLTHHADPSFGPCRIDNPSDLKKSAQNRKKSGLYEENVLSIDRFSILTRRASTPDVKCLLLERNNVCSSSVSMLAWMGGARRKLKATQNRGIGRPPAIGLTNAGQLGGPWLQHNSSHPSTPPRKRKALSAGAHK